MYDKTGIKARFLQANFYTLNFHNIAPQNYMTMLKKIVLVLCFDLNYANQAAVATYSAIKNSKTPIKIYWIVPGKDFAAIATVKDHLESLDFRIHLIRANDKAFIEWKVMEHINQSSYLRLLIPDLINEEKIIYIDSDTLVLEDLSEIWHSDMDELPIGGVKDNPGAINLTKISWLAGDVYINTGVMVMNLGMLRRDRFLWKCQEIYQMFEEKIVFLDQCIINKYAENRKYILDKKWNFLVITELELESKFEAIVSSDRPKIIHFAGGVKPWQKWCNPTIASYWWNYAKELSLPGFHPTRIQNINQALKFADMLDRNSKFRESSKVKTTIINALLSPKR